MRKYRGLTKNGKWVYGNLIVNNARESDGIHKSELLRTYIRERDCTWICETDDKRWMPLTFEVIPETVGQFIGKLDKNKKKIYEGDRIKQAGHIIGGIKKEEGNIEQASNGRYFVRFMWESEMECHADIAEDAEIIGNVHTTPALMEQGK